MTDQALFHHFWRSSASYRVRIALHLAGEPFESVAVDLLQGEQHKTGLLDVNPQGYVPVLEVDGHRFTQSLAILEYLDETRQLGLLPADPVERAKVRALAYCIAVDVHPVCNLSVVTHHAQSFDDPKKETLAWMRRFIKPGLLAFEKLLSQFTQAPYCTGETLSLADLCLMPQLVNAERAKIDFTDCPKIIEVARACAQHDAFKAAHPTAVKP